MTNLSRFGELIRNKRKEKGYTLELVAQKLKIDPSTLCKIEKKERNASKELVLKLSSVLEIDETELLISFLSDKVANEIWQENHFEEVLKIAGEKIKYLKTVNVEQGKINF